MTGRFRTFETPLKGLIVIERVPVGDERGFLERLYCSDTMQAYGLDKPLRQINRTTTHAVGAVRGLHFQKAPYAEIKVVSCLAGRVFDVAVDLRRDSPTFLSWHGEELSAGNHRSMLIPEGFAHGFQTLTTDCTLLYLHTADYAPAAEAGFNACDPLLSIKWPLPISQRSDRDVALPNVPTLWEGIS